MPQTDFMYHVSFQYFDGYKHLHHYGFDECLKEYYNLRDVLATLASAFDVQLSYSKVYRDVSTDLVAASVVPFTEKLRARLSGRGDMRAVFLIHRTQRATGRW
ncbi:MAG: hypothetical protein EOO37_00125 [Cytophagaceae bacterium]|nr:MAG: hypothetical protein EOO37_00125 [Cytophagaceae bacterium]